VSTRHVDHPAPHPTYVAAGDGPLQVDPDVYGPLGDPTRSRTPVERLTIPERDGRAWAVPAGHICRISLPDGPQVVDLNVWNLHDPRERFWASRTRQFYGSHLTTGHRLWSTLPFLRPLATFIADSIAYGYDPDGAGCHDLLGTRCDPYVNQLLAGTAYDFHCHSNLTRAVLPYGLTEFDVHDVINLFQVTGLMPDDKRYFMKASPGRPGDHVELLAETDLLMAASACPGGDLAVPLWGPEAGAEPSGNPVDVEVLRPDDELLRGWRPAVRAGYRGMGDLPHGLRPPAGHPPMTDAVDVSDARSGGGA
jgi:uncharacterized protein